MSYWAIIMPSAIMNHIVQGSLNFADSALISMNAAATW